MKQLERLDKILNVNTPQELSLEDLYYIKKYIQAYKKGVIKRKEINANRYKTDKEYREKVLNKAKERYRNENKNQ